MPSDKPKEPRKIPSNSPEISPPKIPPKKPVKSGLKCNITHIGRRGRLDERSAKKYRLDKENVNYHQEVTTAESNKGFLASIFNKEHTEISKSEIVDEMINPDIQYFLTFCCFLYLIRSLHLIFRVFFLIDELNWKLDNTMYEISINFVSALLTLTTSVFGYLFCWKMYLRFAYPFISFLFLSTLAIASRLAIFFTYYDDDTERNVKENEKNVWEVFTDCGLLVLNIVISFFISKLYQQIQETQNTLNFEPDDIVIDGEVYNRTVAPDKRVSWRLKKEIKSRQI